MKLLDFFSLSADSALDKSDGILRLCGGAIRIYMFAIDNKYQQKHITIENIEMTYASFQLQICLQYIQQITEEHIGATYIILSATKEGVSLYSHFGFSELDDDIELSYMDEKHECLDMYKFIKDDEY